MAPRVIYITGFRQHAGKTVASLGLLHLLRQHFSPEELAYIKPVGQELVELDDGTKVDKDALVIKQFADIAPLDMKYVSPVRLGSGFTKNFLTSRDREAETANLENKILEAVDHFRDKKVIVAEGTGHPGVGGIVGLSNARVGNLLNAEILFLSGGGIGKALDMLEVDLSYFIYSKCNVRGIIFNKLIPDKIPIIREYITEDLINEKYGTFPKPLRIFGCLPEMDSLNKPCMRVLLRRFKGAKALGDPLDNAWARDCRGIRVLSLMAEFLHPEDHIQPGDVVFLGAASRSRRIKLLSYQRALSKSNGLAGIILTCGRTTPLDPQIEEQIIESGVPAIYVQEDTAVAESIVLKACESSKIQVYDTLKYEAVKKLYSESFDYTRLVKALNLGPA